MTNRQKWEGAGSPDLPATAWAVLGLLSFRGARTGYELKKWADASLRFFHWSPAISQIYAKLRRLERWGLATSRTSASQEPRAARRYTLTDAGRAALAAWADGVDDPGPPVLKHPLVLRLWLGHLATPETLRALVERHLARPRDELAEVRGTLRRAERVPQWAFPRVALAWSERRHLAELALAEEMLADPARLAAAGPATGA